MRLHIPTGLTAVLASFDQVLVALSCLSSEAEELISTSFRGRLEPAYRQLVALSNRHAQNKHAWSQALATRNDELGRLRRLVRDAWLMLRRRDQRERHAGLLLMHYQLPHLAPPHASVAVWLQHARNLVNGEARALAAGHAPMAFPSAAELAQSLARAEQAEAVAVASTLRLKDAETDLRQQQRLATHLLRRLAARLRESQYDQEPAQVRTLLRCFGYRFTPTPSDDATALTELALSENQPAILASPRPEPSHDRPPTLAAKGGAVIAVPEPKRLQAPTPATTATRLIETLRSWTLAPGLDRLKRLAHREAS